MMLYQQTALAGLALLNRLALAFQPVAVSQDENQELKLDGYVGYLSTPPTGDWLTTTHCYCEQPRRLDAPNFEEGSVDVGSFFQYEYYNYHGNATYVMVRWCRVNHEGTRTCVTSNRATCERTLKDDCETLCSSWPRSHAPKDDHWCMTLDDYGRYGSSMGLMSVIFWNNQKRCLANTGGQGRREEPNDDAWAVCEGLCQAQVGMSSVSGHRQEVFEDLDDMCYGCNKLKDEILKDSWACFF